MRLIGNDELINFSDLLLTNVTREVSFWEIGITSKRINLLLFGSTIANGGERNHPTVTERNTTRSKYDLNLPISFSLTFSSTHSLSLSPPLIHSLILTKSLTRILSHCLYSLCLSLFLSLTHTEYTLSHTTLNSV